MASSEGTGAAEDAAVVAAEADELSEFDQAQKARDLEVLADNVEKAKARLERAKGEVDHAKGNLEAAKAELAAAEGN